jgi:hypothetical protein
MRKLVTILVALGALAFAAPALAASPVVLTAGPVKVKDYKMQLIASESGAKDSLLVLFTRGSGASTQTHTYSFASGVDLKVKPGLAGATLKANLGQFGSIAMSFAGGGKAVATTPAGCTGAKYVSKRGSLGGAFRLVADSSYFRTISQKKLPAALGTQQGSGQLNCGGAGGQGTGGKPAGALTLSAVKAEGASTFMVSATRGADGAVTQSAMQIDRVGTTTVMHAISAKSGRTSFDAAADLTSARLAAAGPFLSGTLSFASDAAAGASAFGELSGDFVAKFDSIGRRSPVEVGANGILQRS